jgi:formylglycine-generating enzyme required for sulfatase activity
MFLAARPSRGDKPGTLPGWRQFPSRGSQTGKWLDLETPIAVDHKSPLYQADGSQAAVFQQVYGKSLTQVQADLEQYWRGTPGHRGARSRPATNVLCNEIQAYLAGIQQQ